MKVLFIRSPWGQGIIVDKAVNYIQDKTGTQVSLDKAFITFDGNIEIEGLYLEDMAGDTLIYSRRLEANVPIWPIVNGNGYSIEYAHWEGLTARIKREDTVNGFNYQFLADAFASTDTTTTTTEPFKMSIGDIELNEFDITLHDQVEQLDIVLKFDRFYLAMNELDLEKMIVDIDQVQLKNAIIKYDKDTVTAVAKAEPDADPNTDTSIAEAITDDANDSPLPKITVGNLKIESSNLAYASIADGMNLNTSIGLLETAISTANVQEGNYVVDFLTLNNSDTDVLMTTVSAPEPFVFEWPELEMEVYQIKLNNNDVYYSLDGAQITPGTFNENALDFDNVHLYADNLIYKDAAASVNITELSGKEASGIKVHQLSACSGLR